MQEALVSLGLIALAAYKLGSVAKSLMDTRLLKEENRQLRLDQELLKQEVLRQQILVEDCLHAMTVQEVDDRINELQRVLDAWQPRAA